MDSSPLDVKHAAWLKYEEANKAVFAKSLTYWLTANGPLGVALADSNGVIQINTRADALWIVTQLTRVFGLNQCEVTVQ